jgi:16S rRNA (adenine1518-N6/adenine1519-N6)-dimethyltransferase
MEVRAKKHLGQHFLTNTQIAKDIADSLVGNGYTHVIEIGPGKGVLTEQLLPIYGENLTVIDIDTESIAYLNHHFPELHGRIMEGDFLEMDLLEITTDKLGMIGNYPYNISTQIMFKVLDNKDQIVEISGMFQKEVAVRIASPPGNKQYGLTSVLLQTWYDIEYLFSVGPEHFDPPPKVNSGVIRLIRNSRMDLGVPEKFYKRVVKMAFGQRRKTLRNSLKPILSEAKISLPPEYDAQRPEQLGVEDFLKISQLLYSPNEKDQQ